MAALLKSSAFGRHSLRVFPILALFAMAGLTAFMGKHAHADMIDTSSMKPWEVCALCHNLNGISRMAKFPKLAGQKAAYIEKQLNDFRNAKRTNDGGAMAAIVADELDPKNIPVVAKYFSSLPPPPPTAPEDGMDLSAAEALFTKGAAERGIPACASCHVEQNKKLPLAPRITAQHEGYIAKQLRDFRAQDRGNDDGSVMHNIAKELSDEEIDTLAVFVAAQPRKTEQAIKH